VENVYFALTEELNRNGRIAILGSGQAVVWHRLAIMSKDGDWILRENENACARVLEVLEKRSARYRPGAPLDIRWLSGGWSSHFEFQDHLGRRIRCDFFTRPPRLDRSHLEEIFTNPALPPVIELEALIRMKQTQRAKDWAVIGEVARRLPEDRELALTSDPDRIFELAPKHPGCDRPSVKAALGGDRKAVVRALAEEIYELQLRDRDRLARYEHAAAAYLAEVARLDKSRLALPAGHRVLLDLAERLLPRSPAQGAELGDGS
jgi:hypothetical protein